MVKLRPYQIEAVDAVKKRWRDDRATLLVQATGTGKTIVFARIAKDITDHNGRVLILAHRDELIEQARDKLMTSQDLEVAVEKAELHTMDSWDDFPVTIGSVQSLRKKRLLEFDPSYFSHIIIDEAHHAPSESYRNIVDYFGNAKVLGVTATPFRGDKKKLASVFDSIAYEYPLIKAINDGYLCPIVTKMIPLEIDITDVHVRAGDFKAEEISTSLDPYLEKIADIMAVECKDRKTVVFLPLIATSKKLNVMLNKRGLKSEEINGKSPDRKEILERFESGHTRVLCNSMLLTEGWDCPSLDCIVNLRPTRSTALYTQIIGRGTRLCPGKENLLILDFLWLTEKHDLCRPSVLVAESAQERTIIDRLATSGEEVDLTEALERSKEEILREREEKLAKELSEKRKNKAKLIDPVQYGISIKAEDLIDYVPCFMWEKRPMTDKQRKFLESKDVDVSQIPNAGYASKIIDRLIARTKAGLATPKQIRLLERYGFKNVGLWSFKTANAMIARIAKNNWKIPRNVKPEVYTP